MSGAKAGLCHDNDDATLRRIKLIETLWLRVDLIMAWGLACD